MSGVIRVISSRATKPLPTLLRQDPTRQDYVIIDALDECPIESREHFYELILDRIEKHEQTSSYNFLFTSRK